MELYANLRIIRKNFWLVILATLAAALGAAYIDHHYHSHTVYVGTATLVLDPNLPNRALIGQIVAAQQGQSGNIDLLTLVGTYDAYFVNPANAQRAIAQYDRQFHARLPLTPDQLAHDTSTQLIPGTLLYQINVSDYDKQAVLPAAQALAQLFLQDDSQAARAQQEVSNPNPQLSDALGSFWTDQTQALQKQMLDVLHDRTLSHAQRLSRVVSLQKQLAAIQASQAQALAVTQPQGSGSGGAGSQVNTATVSSFAGPTVLVRSALVRNIILFATLGGFIVGLALALLREYLDTSLRSSDEVAELLALPVLATVSLFRRRRGRLPARETGPRSGVADPAPTRRDGHGVLPALITLGQPFHAASESFRNLRTGLRFAGATRKVRTIVVTSALPGEGKSVTAANLAVVMAQSGERVILVDADMRRPVQHTMFGLAPTSGLSTLYLEDECDLRAAVEAVLRPTAVPNLRVVDAGPVAPNPAELLASARTGAVIELLEQQADVVIFDTPAMGLLTDAVILAAHADGTLLVVRSRTTRRELIKTAVSRLKAVDARVLGVVFNMADTPGSRQAEYYRRARRAARGTLLAVIPGGATAPARDGARGNAVDAGSTHGGQNADNGAHGTTASGGSSRNA